MSSDENVPLPAFGIERRVPLRSDRRMTQRPSRAAEFVALVFAMCQLHRGPDEMPYSKVLFGALVAASVALDVLGGAALGDASHALPRSLVSTSLLLALCWIALALRQLGNRYVQTASALIACSIVLTLLALPLTWLLGPTPSPPAPLTPLQTLLGWALLGIFVWNIAVNAHIVGRALDAPYALGLALALAWAIADWSLSYALFDASSG